MEALNIHNRFLKLLVVTTIFFFCVHFSFAQVSITNTQTLHFGTICLTGAGGTVTVGSDGSRASTGNLILLSLLPVAQPAIFDIMNCSGGSVSLTFNATTILTGSNKGSLTLDIGPTDKGPNGSSFTTNDCIITPLRVGGTLHIPDAAIAGTYTGSFDVTINME